MSQAGTAQFDAEKEAMILDAVERFLEREAGGVDAYLDELDERSPMRG